MSSEPLVVVRDLVKTFVDGGVETPVLKGVNFSLAFCSERMEQHLTQLQRHYGEETEAWRMAHALSHEKLNAPIQLIFDGGLHQYVTGFLRDTANLARQVERDYRFVE